MDDRKLIVRIYQMQGQAYAEVAELVPPEYAEATCKGYNDAAEKGFVYVVAPNDAAVLMLQVTRPVAGRPGGGRAEWQVMRSRDDGVSWRCVKRVVDEEQGIAYLTDTTALHRDFILDELRHGRPVVHGDAMYVMQHQPRSRKG